MGINLTQIVRRLFQRDRVQKSKPVLPIQNPRRVTLGLEVLESREVPAVDLIGFDASGQGSGFAQNYFQTLTSTPAWGRQLSFNFSILNQGNSGGGTHSVAIYLSTDTNITTSDHLLAQYNGLNVPNANSFIAYSGATFILPASNPFGSGTSFTFGMIVDSNNTVAESNESNNSNQGNRKDKQTISIQPPVASVADSQTPSTDRNVNFGSIIADGSGNSQTTHTVTLSNSAGLSALKVLQNGISLLGGSHFKIVSILSNRLSQVVNVAGGSSLIAANSSETWTIQLAFDPLAVGTLTDTLRINTDDPANPIINVALSGSGVARPNLVVGNGGIENRTVPFSDVAVDGAGGIAGTASLTLSNSGSGPLIVNQNGLSLPVGPYSVTGITSSTQGAISLSTGSKTIAANSAETWTVGLKFDPTSTGLVQQALTVLSNDPDEAAASITLLGTGKTPPQLASTPSSLAFGNVYSDGVGGRTATQTLSLSNSGQLPLNVAQNGISFNSGSHYRVTSITSSTQGPISLSAGPATLAPNATETWSVTVVFDPTIGGSLSDSLRVASNDPTGPATVALSGTGLNQPGLLINQPTTTEGNLVALGWVATLADGVGGRVSTRTLPVTNIGPQPLNVSSLRLVNGTAFRITGVTSSLGGSINPATGGTIQPNGAEVWTVSVDFDPIAAGGVNDIFRVSTNNDPLAPTRDVNLSGEGVIPVVNVATPSRAINVSAGRGNRISWSGDASPGNGSYSVFFDTDTNPASGLVPIVTGLSQKATGYTWQVPTGLIGSTVYVYVALTDGTITRGNYAAGSMRVEPVGTDRLLSAPVTDQSIYTLSAQVNGTPVGGNYALVMGRNSVYLPVGGATYEYQITRVPTLVDADHLGYDELGNVTSATDSAGHVAMTTYDLLSRPTRTTYPDGNSVEFAYDPAGNLLTMQDSTGWQIYNYDVADRLTGVTYSPTNNPNDPAALKIGYEYDLTGRRTAMVYPSGKRVEYVFTTGGKLNRVTEKNSGQPDLITTYSYTASTGLLNKTTRPNDTETLYGFDTAGRLNDIHHRRTSTQATVLRYQYSLDTAGRRTQVVVTAPSGVRAEKYSYDDLNRLNEVTYSDDNGTIDTTDRVVRYAYDRNGNRLTQTTFAGGVAAGATETLSYAYGFENRLLSVTDQLGVVRERFAYDHRGNQIQKVTPTSTTQFNYDSRNLLLSVNDGVNHIEYQYDGAGRRVGQTVNGVTTRFVVDPSSAVYQTVEERTGAGALSADYAYGLERVSGRLPGQTAQTFYLTDALGSVGALSDPTGGNLGNYSYEAFGKTRSAPVSPNQFQFTGERLDTETGQVYLRARSYEPSLGRFVQKDPLGFVDGPSHFVYSTGNPVIFADPLGTDIELRGGIGVNGLVEGLFVGGYLSPSANVGVALNLTNIGDSRFTFTPGVSGGVGIGIPGYIGAGGLVTGGVSWGDPTHAGWNPLSLSGELQGAASVADVGISGAINLNSSSIMGTISRPPIASFGFGVEAGVGANASATYGSRTFGELISDAWQGVSKLATNAWNATVEASQSILNAVDRVLFPPAYGVQVSGLYDGDTGQPLSFGSYRPGGVLIDKAASLVGSNIKDITGASFDPATNQLVFLGNSSPASLHDIDLGLFYTAIQSVYGSAAPPFVTLDPPAKLISSNFNLGSGDGVIPSGKVAPIPINYTPFTPTNIDDMTLSFKVNGTDVTARLDAVVHDGSNGTGNVRAGGRPIVTLRLGSVTGLPTGVTLTQPTQSLLLNGTITANTITLNDGSGYTLTTDARGQQSNFYFTINNTTASPVNVSNITLKPDRQHRKLGGRVEDTKLGWIMHEADRVMKALGIGKDHLTGATYSSTTPGMPPGYMNLLERYAQLNQSGGFNNRFWFTPNEQNLKRYIDPVTGAATVMFSAASVKLNTEALVLGQLEDNAAKDWANFFTARYDQFANMSFPVYDPADPTGQSIINVKIFEQLRDAMKAVALARFFNDNGIPLDTWWINQYQPTKAFIPTTIPTLTNSIQNGATTLTMWGGVQIKTPNTYLPDAVAASLAAAVKNQRPGGTGDLPSQAWSVAGGTGIGNLNAVAATLDAEKQDASVNLSAADLSFASPGGRTLTFDRYYDSGFLGNKNLGTGWQATQFDLQFERPTFTDEYRLMRYGSNTQVPIFGAISETYLRSGELRFFDRASGRVLNFNSSLRTTYALDNHGNPIMAASGLSATAVPTFTAGIYRDGSSLAQDPVTHNYILTRPDGSKIEFEPFGKLVKTTDTLGNEISYSYDGSGRLTQISDSSNQKLVVTYGTDGRMQYVSGPDATGTPQRRVAFLYTNGRLTQVDTQALQTGTTYTTARSTRYLYNTDGQVSGVIGPDGVTSLTNASDIRGRSTARTDAVGTTTNFGFTQDATGVRTTQMSDAGSAGNDPLAHGHAALRYFTPGASSAQQFDPTARPTRSTDALGNATKYGYSGTAQAPTSVTLPTPGRPTISVQRNAADLPTVITDPANVGGTPVRVTYTAANLPLEVTDTKGRVTRYTYTAFNAVATVTVNFGTPVAATTTYSYNAAKLLQSVTDSLNRLLASYTYDAFGRVLTSTDGDGAVTTNTYDSLGRLKRVFDPRLTGAVNYIEYFYNDNDQVVRIATPTGDQTFQYDPTTKRQTSETDLAGNITQYSYNPTTGQLTRVTQVSSAGNAVTEYEYNRRGELVLLIAPEGTRTTFRSDVLGRPTATVEDNGVAPTATGTITVTSATTLRVALTTSEQVLVAAVKYWQVGQPESSAVTVSQRVNDASVLTFDLTGVNTSLQYNVKVILTDRVGRTTEMPLAVQNTAPSATVSLSSTTPLTNDILTATATKSDPEGDPVSLTFVWTVNGVVRRSVTSATALTDTFDLSQVGNGNRGDTIVVTVTPNDGSLTGPTTNAIASVTNTPPTATVSGPTHTVVGEPLSLTASSTDPDAGDTATYTWTVTRSGTSIASGNGATISFTPTEVGVYSISLSATDSAGGVGSTTKSVTAVLRAAVAQGGITVNPGQSSAVQRSRVTELTVRFNGEVSLAAGAFTLTRQSDNASITDGGSTGPRIFVTTSVVNGATIASLTFLPATGSPPVGSLVEYGSLADGVWVLKVDKTKVTNPIGGMAADFMTPAAGTGRLHRLFGDTDGDGDVDNTDVIRFQRVRQGLLPSLFSAVDFDIDGDVDNTDTIRFQRRLGTTFNTP
ncbi:MAG: RHS repeat-associated core domain-containing protein [Fimbriiglobus sp.]